MTGGQVRLSASMLAVGPLDGGTVPVRILDPRCVAKTWPDYFEALFSVARARREAVDRNDLRELAAGGVLSTDIDEVEAAGMWLHCRIRAEPAQDLVRIGQEGEDCRRWSCICTSRRTTSDTPQRCCAR